MSRGPPGDPTNGAPGGRHTWLGSPSGPRHPRDAPLLPQGAGRARREGGLRHLLDQNPDAARDRDTVNVVVGECFDGWLSDARSLPVRPEHALEAIAAAGPTSSRWATGAGTGTTALASALAWAVLGDLVVPACCRWCRAPRRTRRCPPPALPSARRAPRRLARTRPPWSSSRTALRLNACFLPSRCGRRPGFPCRASVHLQARRVGLPSPRAFRQPDPRCLLRDDSIARERRRTSRGRRRWRRSRSADGGPATPPLPVRMPARVASVVPFNRRRPPGGAFLVALPSDPPHCAPARTSPGPPLRPIPPARPGPPPPALPSSSGASPAGTPRRPRGSRVWKESPLTNLSAAIAFEHAMGRRLTNALGGRTTQACEQSRSRRDARPDPSSRRLLAFVAGDDWLVSRSGAGMRLPSRWPTSATPARSSRSAATCSARARRPRTPCSTPSPPPTRASSPTTARSGSSPGSTRSRATAACRCSAPAASRLQTSSSWRRRGCTRRWRAAPSCASSWPTSATCRPISARRCCWPSWATSRTPTSPASSTARWTA